MKDFESKWKLARLFQRWCDHHDHSTGPLRFIDFLLYMNLIKQEDIDNATKEFSVEDLL